MDNDKYTKLESTTDATLLARDLKCRHGRTNLAAMKQGASSHNPILVELNDGSLRVAQTLRCVYDLRN